MTMTVLCLRLLPPIADPHLPLSLTTGFTGISAQWLSVLNMNMATHWSVAPDLCNQLTAALEGDLDSHLAQHPELQATLENLMQQLNTRWAKLFGSRSKRVFGDLESGSNSATETLLEFAMDAFEAIETEAFNPSPSSQPANFEIQVWEDKRWSRLPAAVRELSRRGSALGIVRVEVADAEGDVPAHQPNWWVIVNKGALYAAAYDTDWVVFAAITVVCVGWRRGDHFFWSPISNRRDFGDEVRPHTPELVEAIFGPDPPLSQDGIPLLVLAVVLKAAMSRSPRPWLSAIFQRLAQIGSPSPSLQLVEIGILHRTVTQTTQRIPPSRLTDRVRVTGRWQGELANAEGYSVHILRPLARGADGAVRAGLLMKQGIRISEIAIKVSDNYQGLLQEYACYAALVKVMSPYIPHCYGVAVTSRTAFLITALLQDHTQGTMLTKAQRGSLYKVVMTMHDAGWLHNDILDPANTTIHNVIWTATGKPVLIDLVTAARHVCPGSVADGAGFEPAHDQYLGQTASEQFRADQFLTNSSVVVHSHVVISS
ncbi:hypothetical protein R3P38DRAFT_3332288 [Favolaschia claudopus]|uniref:Protein kinase domain-containing protein n=1 Tax=Favolaschia claudopus TaxID=2862362 RepID=A0AAV9ZNL0_9AGAR